MTRTSATVDGRVTTEMRDYYRTFAEGGFPLIITEGTYPDEHASQGYLYQPGIANDAQLEAWKPLVRAVKGAGAAIVLQLMHAGALVQGNRFSATAVGPTPVRPKGAQLTMHYGKGKYGIPVALDAEGIRTIVADFALAARRAQVAGFDGVELHGANGYLLDQFLTAYTNTRRDEYGGSTQNRVRFVVEVVHAVRDAVGADYPVGVRISQTKVNDASHRWPGGEEDARIIFSELADAGASYLHTTEPDATRPAFEGGDTLARLARTHGRLPVIANGNLGDPPKARGLLADGSADIIAVAKPALANSDWPLRVARTEALDPFDVAMIHPLATLSNAAAWRARNGSERLSRPT